MSTTVVSDIRLGIKVLDRQYMNIFFRNYTLGIEFDSLLLKVTIKDISCLLKLGTCDLLMIHYALNEVNECLSKKVDISFYFLLFPCA